MPCLVELLPGGVQLVQELRYPWHKTLGISVAPSAATTAAAATASGAAVTVGERLRALDALEQPVDIQYLFFYDNTR